MLKNAIDVYSTVKLADRVSISCIIEHINWEMFRKMRVQPNWQIDYSFIEIDLPKQLHLGLPISITCSLKMCIQFPYQRDTKQAPCDRF